MLRTIGNPAVQLDDPKLSCREWLVFTMAIMTKDQVLYELTRFRRNRHDEFGIVRIGVFGSTARGQITDESDVDVVVEMAKPDLLLLVGIKQELEGLLRRQVDIVRYRDDMNPFLRHRIDQEAVYV